MLKHCFGLISYFAAGDTLSEYNMGLDVGSTTIKILILKGEEIVFKLYRRHNSDIRKELKKSFDEIPEEFLNIKMSVKVTGSAGLAVSELLGMDFVQEVIAETYAVDIYYPEADVIIELGGEDAKITFLKPFLEQRMNGTCAGGTGAFIDQMASLLQTDASGLNELAKEYKSIYTIASRCGVFAKSDLQPLINEGAPKADLAASVLHSVVNQTIAGLACGRKIKGNIVFLGGPLAFMSELRKAYERTLKDDVKSFTTPEDASVFVALGAALTARDDSNKTEMTIKEIKETLGEVQEVAHDIGNIRALFENDEEKREFDERHNKNNAVFSEMRSQEGPCFLGIDAGSTTTKAVLINEDNEILYSYYTGNRGNPAVAVMNMLKDIYAKLPETAWIAKSCVTGYGERFIKTAMNLDEGEIETMAHYKAASHFSPDVDFIIDIGGQDMKCMKIKNGVIDSIMLNEACSSGCGSFIQTFAKAAGMEVEDFSEEGLKSKKPVDLGTRCTVFMNSKVKQAQKEGSTIGDISAGLSYSVVKNALYKVIKIKNPKSLGKKIVVQGGTFYNNAILRCFELVSGIEVVRPDIAGLMGAYGAALIAKERTEDPSMKSMLLDKKQLDEFAMDSQTLRCKACGNRCKLTVTKFKTGTKFISGNRCEIGAGNTVNKDTVPNLFQYKYRKLFSYEPLSPEKAYRGELGIPRALNVFENYPLWFTIFTKLGYRVVISKDSDHKLFRSAMDTISSESICYPAKLAHGHIEDLISRGIKKIFYPCLPHEQKENEGSNNSYNCPIVASYPDVIKNNMDKIKEGEVTFVNPFLPMKNKKKLTEHLVKEFSFDNLTEKEVYEAVKEGFDEYASFKEDILKKGDETVEWLKENNKTGIVLAGRPYHLDFEVNHGIPEMIAGLGFAVLTEDSVARPGKLKRPIRVVDQWTYHTRLYESAAAVTENPNLELVQLTSFGCGLDAVTSDQVQDILEAKGKIYTLLKIDEISNLGAARIRMRSLKVALEERGIIDPERYEENSYVLDRKIYTEELKKRHEVIAPQMSPVHFKLLEAVFRKHDYDLHLLENATRQDIEIGLKYVNNDACYPTIIVVGQLVNSFIEKKHDPDNTSVFITQTGGGCRATNYTAFLRKALADAGFGQVPVVALSVTGIEKNPGLKIGLKMLDSSLKALVIGDLLQTVLLRTRPYEKVEGSANELYRKWLNGCYYDFLDDKEAMKHNVVPPGFRKKIDGIVEDFDNLPLKDIPRKPRVGIVGEILVKFHPDANNNAIGVIEQEGCEAVVPGLIDFFLYCFFNAIYSYKYLDGSRKQSYLASIGIWIIESYRRYMRKRLEKTGKFMAPAPFYNLTEYAKPILSLGNSCGEGWFLTAEMVELIKHDVPNIICMQPFACLPNHVTGKGMIKELRKQYPQSNIVPIDYDPGASEVNQLNRIKLMISSAFKREKGSIL